MNNGIPNWFDYPDLYSQLAEQIPDGATFVEVGAWVGHSVSFFAQEIKRHGKQCRIVAVDTFQGEPGDSLQESTAAAGGGTFRALFDATLAEAGVTDMVEVIEGDSADSARNFADGSVWGVFIDADHATESVRRDIASWLPKVAEIGVLAGHDIDAPSVAAAVTMPHVVCGRCWVRL